MSINSVLRTSVSGMNAQANKLSSVSDNIANSGTTGYKRSDVQFSTLIYQDKGNDYQSGGVVTDTRRMVSLQGAIVSTASASDLAIQGNGFFVVSDDRGNEFYTRAGSFVPRTDIETNQTYLVNAAGYRLQGAGGPLEIPFGEVVDPQASTTAKISLQLPVNGQSDTYNSSFVAYNARGEAVTVAMVATRNDADDWTVTFDAGSGPVTAEIAFDPETGAPTIAPGTDGPLELPVPAATNGGQTAVTIEFGQVVSYDAAFAARADVDGNPTSGYTDFSISSNGIVYGILSTGTRVEIDRVQLAQFQSPDQLHAISGNVFQESIDSGNVQYGFAGDLGFGSLFSNAIEQSNVDLASELTSMIESQRAYGANSKVFQTGSEMMDLLINLKR